MRPKIRRASGTSEMPRLDDRLGGQPVDPLALELDRSLAGPDDAQDRLHRRRLPGGVAAEEADDLALAHLEVDGLQDLDRAVVRDDVGELKHGRPGGRDTPRAPRACPAPSRRCPRRSSCRGRARRRDSQTPRTRPMSCSIRRIVTPWSRIRTMSRMSSRVSVGFMPAAGSSRSKQARLGRERPGDLEPAAVRVGQGPGRLGHPGQEPLAEEAEQRLRALARPADLVPHARARRGGCRRSPRGCGSACRRGRSRGRSSG